MATCESPISWLAFETTEKKQDVYVAANTPVIARFADELNYNAVVLGPGLPVLETDGLPSDVISAMNSLELWTGLKLKSPESFAQCKGFVDNVVMRQYTSVQDGRCSEFMKFKGEYEEKNPLLTWLEWKVWWLFSKDLTMGDTGSYYVASWLTQRSSGEIANGKFEITIGPWTWGGYAPKNLAEEIQAQGTTCTCATNVLSYGEQEVARLGNISSDVFVDQLPLRKVFGRRRFESAICLP